MSTGSYSDVPVEVVIAGFLMAVAGAMKPLELPANRSAHVFFTHTTIALFLVFGPIGLAITLSAALAVGIARIVSGATRRPTIHLVVTCFAMSIGIGLAHTASLALGVGLPRRTDSLADLLRAVAVAAIAYATYAPVKELVSRRIFDRGPVGRSPADVLERPLPLYAFGALVNGPMLVLSLTANELAGAWGFITTNAVSATVLLAIPFEVRRVLRVRALSDDRSRQARMVALSEHSARLAHHMGHQIALIGLSLDRIDERLVELGVANEPVVLEERSRIATARDDLRDLLTRERTEESSNPAKSWHEVFATPAARVASLADQRAIRIVTNLDALPSGCPPNPRKLEQAWFNLVENAVSAARSSIVLDARVDQTSVIVSVGDDGPGMSDEVAARATEPFFSTKPGGTGMGLAIACAVAEELDGELAIESSAAGTIVSLRLPLAAHEPTNPTH